MGGGLFQDYEHMPDSYDAFLKKKSEDRKANETKQSNIGGRPFALGMNSYTWKYHDCFIPQEKQKDYVNLTSLRMIPSKQQKKTCTELNGWQRINS